MVEERASGTTPEEQEQPPYILEGARSGRARCKSCQRKIDKGKLRLGILIEGPFGTGYLWHHLNCAARRQLDAVKEAYAAEAWKEAEEPPAKVPTLESLEKLREKAAKAKKERKELPYVEIAPSGRSRCKGCGEPIAEGAPRVVLGREVEFGRMVRTSPVKVHPRCVEEELERPDAAFEAEGLETALRAHSTGVAEGVLDTVVQEMGDLE